VIYYLDTSTLLRVLFGQPRALRVWGRWERAYTSEIAGVEARRTVDRLRLGGALDDVGVAAAHTELRTIENGIGRISLTRGILQRAALPMATVVKTLDALHLASALVFQERRGLALTFATHDEQQAMAARALGFSCVGV
jgi:predicted nucleic acid-binding protein